MKANLRVFTRGDKALEFMTKLGPLRVVSVSETTDPEEVQITVWYWEPTKQEPE